MRTFLVLVALCSSACIVIGGFIIPVCGNGFINEDEACDDGNDVDGDGCDSECVLSCGNGSTDENNKEECDNGKDANGNAVDGDGCDKDCKLETCGDAKLNDAGQEECDDGNVTDGDGCNAACRIEFAFLATCGNNVLDQDEVCDDGNTAFGDGCRGDCRELEGCGNGLIEGNEECDDGNSDGFDGCAACSLTF
jgi:cysteine-rich repeat protein